MPNGGKDSSSHTLSRHALQNGEIIFHRKSMTEIYLFKVVLFFGSPVPILVLRMLDYEYRSSSNRAEYYV
jgi:hypothetical protein